MIKAVLFDWGNTLMVDHHDQKGPMHTWSKIETIENAKECLEIVSKSIPLNMTLPISAQLDP